MSTYKLTYFNLEARAEWIRWIFLQVGVPFEDIRVPFQDWPAMKPTTPLGCLPVLEVDGKQIAGSIPIARYVAEKHGLAGENAIENAQLAGIGDVIQDIQNGLFKFHFEKDEDKKAALKKEFFETGVPKYLDVLEKQIKKNASPEGWLFGSKVTYIDLRVPRIIGVLKRMDSAVLDNYPGVAALDSKILALPKIAKWIAERPTPEKETY